MIKLETHGIDKIRVYFDCFYKIDYFIDGKFYETENFLHKENAVKRLDLAEYIKVSKYGYTCGFNESRTAVIEIVPFKDN